MKYFIVYILLISLYNENEAQIGSYDDGKVGIQERVALLKQRLMEEIKLEQKVVVPGLMDDRSGVGDIDPNMEYKESDENGPITPIMDFDERKFKDRFKFKPLVSKYTTRAETVTSAEKFSLKPLRSRNRKKKISRSPANIPSEIFYRRWDGRDDDRDTPIKWIHCLDLLTPYWLEGKEIDIRDPNNMKMIMSTESVVLRLVHLLSANTKDDTKDEIFSVLYQISTIPIRLYMWEDTAVQMLMNQIITDRQQNFAALKHGVKKLFAKWHLDIGNITNLLQQTRIFRPPCIQTSELQGSTQTSRGTRYTKSKNAKTTCEADEANSCEGK